MYVVFSHASLDFMYFQGLQKYNILKEMLKKKAVYERQHFSHSHTYSLFKTVSPYLQTCGHLVTSVYF